MNSQTHDESRNKQFEDEVDLLELWRALMRGKWIIFGFTAVFSIASVFYALSLPNMYKSTAVLAPAQSSSGGLSSLGGQLGGLASFAGINVGSGGNKTAEAIEILKSWAFIEEFIQEQNIAPEVFAVKGLNIETNELIYDTEIYDPKDQVWKRETSKGKRAEPSSWELYRKFLGRYLTISKAKRTDFTSISIEFFSPELSKLWVDALVEKINRKVRDGAAREAERNISFLKTQVAAIDLSSLQEVFFSLIEEQTKNLMLTQNSLGYVFKTINEPRVPEVKSSPSRALVCIIGTIIGLLFGSIIVLVRATSTKSQ